MGKNRLRRLGFNIPVDKVTAWQAVMLNKAAEELPSESDITKADDIELQEIVKSTEDLISQLTQTDDLSFMRAVRSGHPAQKHSRFTKS